VVPGNFGQLDLAGNNGSNAPGSCQNVSDDDKLCDNTVNGYYGDVSGTIQGSPGNNFNPFNGPFDTLEGNPANDNDGTLFWVPVFSNSVGGNGNNAAFTVKYWMEVRPLDHCFDAGGGNSGGGNSGGGNSGGGNSGGGNSGGGNSGTPDCRLPDEAGNATGWFKWKVLRIVSVVDWPTGPPLTSNAVRYAPRICGVDDGDVSYCE